MDNFTLFHFRFLSAVHHQDERFWSHTVGTPAHTAWAGLAFERVCLWHLPQIRHALGISGVVTSAYTWHSDATEERPGAQIDLLIERNDNIINLCEMKFSDTEYTITQQEDEKLRNRKAVFQNVTRTRKSVHITMVTTYGVKHNAYWGDVQSEVTMEDLFSI